MPIYDFKCRRCGHRFEQLVKVDGTAACPSCAAPGAERQFSTSAAVSTGRTRERSLKVARARAIAVKQEKDRAHREYMENHIKDHS